MSSSSTSCTTPPCPSGYDSANIGGDILSSVSNSTQFSYTPNNPNGDALFARYFYVSNLLVQFSDYGDRESSSGLPTDDVFPEGNLCTITFPIGFGATPYSVIVTPAGAQGQTSDWNIYITISNVTSTGFSFYIENHPGNIVWTAIGPPPSSST